MASACSPMRTRCGSARSARRPEPPASTWTPAWPRRRLPTRASAPPCTPPPRATSRRATAQRALELEQSFALLDELLTAPLVPVVTDAGATAPEPLGIGRVESARGETVCVLVPDGDRIGRMHLRTASW